MTLASGMVCGAGARGQGGCRRVSVGAARWRWMLERVGMREGGGVVWVLRMGDVDVAELLWMLWGFYVDVVYG